VDYRVKFFCFAASYSVALGLELWHQFRPRPVFRLIGLCFGAAGLLAQTIYLAVERPALSGQFGLMLFLSWIISIFYLYGAIHHNRLAWAIFSLPLVLGLLALAAVIGPSAPKGNEDTLWGSVHGIVLLLAAVGLCVGFLASLMYLVQLHRLRVKTLPGHGMKLLSLERLEAMHRRAINLAFPLLTAGLLLGAVLLFRSSDRLTGWLDLRVVSAIGLWFAFTVMIVLRYSHHLRGRSVAFLTIAVFVLMVCCLALPHLSINGSGGAP
jgi:ABC-type transport system involved in cytochrome c biogenesis permease subunit